MRKPINGSPGLWTAGGSANMPPGALRRCLGVYPDPLTGELRRVRPYVQYAGTSINAKAITSFSGWLYLTAGGQLLAETTPPGTFTAMTIPVASMDPYDTEDIGWVRALEAGGNFYISTALGFIKLTSQNTTAYISGVPRALDTQLSLVASGSLLASGNSAGYRVVFGIQDVNQNLIIGPPSGRAVVTANAAQNVTVKTWIPSAITAASNATSYFVQVYRTAIQTVANVDPGEEMQVVYQAYLTSTDVSNRFISFTDFTPDNLRGAQGYFCPSQEGIAQSNYQPPIAQDCALFKGTSFYANTVSKHRARVQLLGVANNTLTISTGAGGITKSGGNGIITLTGSPDLSNIPTDGTAKVSITGSTTPANNGEFPITGIVAATSITYTNAGAATEPGTASSRAFPSKLTINSVNYYGSLNGTETVASQIFSVATAGSASQNVRDTCASLLRVVNQQTSPTVYGYYDSGPDDGAGKMLFEEVSIGGSQFSIAAGGTLLYNSFNPTIPVAAPWKSQNDAAINRLYRGKPGQPEHVPLVNYDDIGAKSKAILRVLPLREALLVFKEDGLFKVTGDGNGGFAISAFDLSVVLSKKQAACVSLNKAYALTPRGMVEINESSSRVVSGPISNALSILTESSSSLNVAHITATDVDSVVRLYVFGDDLAISRCFVYSTIGGKWGETITSDFDQVWASASTQVNGLSYYFTAKKNVFRDDSVTSADVSSPMTTSLAAPPALKPFATLLSVNAGASTVTIDGGAPTQPVAGDYLLDNAGVLHLVVSNVAGVITLSGGVVNFAAGKVLHYMSNPITVEWHPPAGDDMAYSRFTEVAVSIGARSTLTACTLNAYTEATTSTAIVNMTSANTPLPTNIGTQTLVRGLIPPNMQTARRLSVVFQHSAVNEYCFIDGVSYTYEPMDGREVT